MKVFKFGGASVKNSDSIRNIVEIIRSHGTTELIIVVSAMDKKKDDVNTETSD